MKKIVEHRPDTVQKTAVPPDPPRHIALGYELPKGKISDAERLRDLTPDQSVKDNLCSTFRAYLTLPSKFPKRGTNPCSPCVGVHVSESAAPSIRTTIRAALAAAAAATLIAVLV